MLHNFRWQTHWRGLYKLLVARGVYLFVELKKWGVRSGQAAAGATGFGSTLKALSLELFSRARLGVRFGWLSAVVLARVMVGRTPRRKIQGVLHVNPQVLGKFREG